MELTDMKTIIEMARVAGVRDDGHRFEFSEYKYLERFAALVRADEREVLAQPEQEPVARVIDNGTPEGATEWIPFTNRVEPLKTGDLLYGEPPERPWVELTETDILAASRHWRNAEDFMAGVYWAAGTLKEKNT